MTVATSKPAEPTASTDDEADREALESQREACQTIRALLTPEALKRITSDYVDRDIEDIDLRAVAAVYGALRLEPGEPALAAWVESALLDVLRRDLDRHWISEPELLGVLKGVNAYLNSTDWGVRDGQWLPLEKLL